MEPAERRQLNDLMLRLADGDRSVFDAVFAMLHPVVFRSCLRWLGNSAEAEDASQAALLKVFLEAPAFDPDRDALGWALTIAGFECRSLRQSRRRRREELATTEGLATVSVEDRTPEQNAEDAELKAYLENAMEELAPLDRETVMTILGQADRPAVAPATFRKRAERAVRRIQRIWRARYGLD